ncbi:Laminin subunit alpha-3 [Triplophysa tibetana]|uniref:Laminin subunit alpha-3 n=1 Tax=Triplophysa tibetana TaxID=1572043 RepID=A0A5A9P904_9TELE|nr:Laminin subunit alpha-3 [Triplophysa tibetana]
MSGLNTAVLGALVFGTLLMGMVCGGPRFSHQQPERTQRILYPGINPSSHHESQQIQYPSVHQRRECEYNTAGDQCERCADGYYGDAALRTCRVCPCPLSTQDNNFAVGCSESDGRLKCLCKAGYEGERCERCASGFYGHPWVSAGRCQPCNCPGNSCDSLTGVCRVFLELRDTNTEEQCEECDSCAQTLLNDLEKLDIDLRRMKEQLDLGSLGPSAQEYLQKLKDALAVTTNGVNTFSSTVNKQKLEINQLERDVVLLSDDLDHLKEQAKKRSEEFQKAIANIENSHQRAKDLDTETQNLQRKIQGHRPAAIHSALMFILLDLVKQLTDGNSAGSTLPSEDLLKLLQESERMVKEMEKRNLMPLTDAIRKEQEQANQFLEQVNNITKQFEYNKDASERVESFLNGYETKLKELEDSLKRAVDIVENASGQNGVNAEHLKDVLDRLKELQSERDVVRDQMTLAVNQLKNTEDLLKTFNDSKMEHQELATRLHSATTDLKNRVQEMSQAEAQEKIVKQAEEHAENLQKLAERLQEAVQNVSGLSALSGIEAYKNISDAVNAAQEAALKARQAADRALNDVSQEDLLQKSKDLKDNGNNLLKTAKSAAKDLKGASKDLGNQTKRLHETEKKKKVLEEDLKSVQDELNEIKTDVIDSIIDAAKKTATAANRSTSDTVEQLNNIKAEVKKISISPTVSNVDNVLKDVNKNVKNLSGSIPSLLEKILELNSQLGSANNVSENINKIKELIEEAREAANRIVVPMRFSGNGHVELRPPTDIDDLRAYTALTLSLQRPNRPTNRRRRRQSPAGNLFVFYMGSKNASGDYIGIALRNNFLHLIYKLNGEEYDLKTSSNITESPYEPAFFDKIAIHRIYQDAEIIHTQQFTSSDPKPPQTQEKLGQLSRNLLNLNVGNVVFYVGGYPDDFKPPTSLNYGKYKGCMEFSTFNEKFIGLYNFKNAVNINLESPCKRHIPVTSSQSNYFEGSGYTKVMLENKRNYIVLIQKMQTRSEDALLLYLGDENDDFFYSISLERGYLVMRGQEKDTIFEPEKEVKVIINFSTDIKVIIDQTETKSTGFSTKRFQHYYVGGITSNLRQRYDISAPALKGCVNIISAGGSSPNIIEEVGIGQGCSPELLVVRNAEFSTGSMLQKDDQDYSLQGDVNLSLGFKSTKPDGVLLQKRKDNANMELSMERGHVLLKLQGSIWKSTQRYQNGSWHYLSVVRQGQSVELRVDEDDVGQKLTETSSEVYSSDIVLGKDTFSGCISNVYLRRPEALFRAEDLSSYTATGHVHRSSCSAR